MKEIEMQEVNNMDPNMNVEHCPYCTDVVQNNSTVTFPCKHIVHYKCFTIAVKYDRDHNQETRCPLCRATVVDVQSPVSMPIVPVPRQQPPFDMIPYLQQSDQVGIVVAQIEEPEHYRPRVSPYIYGCAVMIFVFGVAYIVYAIVVG